MTVHVDHQDSPLKSAGQSKMANSLLSRTQTEAVDFLERCVRNAEPLAALTGSAGTGKTMALNTALARCGSAGDRIIRVNNFVAGPLSLHRVLAASLGVGEAAELSAEALEPALRRALAEASKVSPPVLAVDDAQSLLPETLRYLSLLAGLRENGRPVLRILLVGRPGFTVRQAMPVQFTLETMRSEDAREVAAKRLAAAGLTLADGSVQEIVQRAQGNWRKLDALLRTETDDPVRARGKAVYSETAGPRASTSRAGAQPVTRDRTAMATVSGAKGGPSRSAPSPVWMIVLPGLLLAFAGGAVIAYEGGLLGSRPAPSHSLGHAAVPAPSTPVHPAAPTPAAPASAAPGPATQAPAAPTRATRAPATLAPAAPAPTAVVPATPTPAPPIAPTVAPEASSPAPAPPPPQAHVVPQAPSHTAPAPSQAAEAAPPSTPAKAAAPNPGVLTGRFRVNNISSCHHGVCPRWAVLDLDHKTRTVAAFDPSGLHLDPGTLQTLRDGTIDITVSGTLTKGGPDGRTLHADHLDAVAPHHLHGTAEESAPAPTQAEETPAPTTPAPATPGPVTPAPVTQSPQPSFLAFPPGTPASERRPTDAAGADRRRSDDGPLQLAPPPLPHSR